VREKHLVTFRVASVPCELEENAKQLNGNLMRRLTKFYRSKITGILSALPRSENEPPDDIYEKCCCH